jgi:hypothetical protein
VVPRRNKNAGVNVFIEHVLKRPSPNENPAFPSDLQEPQWRPFAARCKTWPP